MSPEKQEKERRERHAAEVTVLVISSLIVLFLLGYSIYHALLVGETPPDITTTAQFDRVTRRGESYVLPVEIRNRTAPTAEDVRIIVQVAGPGGLPEEREFTIQYLPEHSKQTGYVVLENEPTPANVKIEVESFKLP